MKKILLSLAMLLGFASFASADTVKLVVNDATDIVGTKDGDNYVPVSSFKIGDYSFTMTYGEGIPSGSVPKLWLNGGVYQIRMFSQYENKMVMKAPEGVKITKVLINDKANRDAGYTSPNGTVTFPKIDNFTYTQWENAEGATECIIQTDGTKNKNCQYLDLEVTFEKEGGSASDEVTLESICEIYPNATAPAQMMWTSRDLISVDLTFDEPSKAALNMDCKESITMTLNGEPFGKSLSVADAELDTKWGEFTFEPGGEIKNGEYVVTIPEGFFTFDGKPVAKYTATYTISGLQEPISFESVLENILPSDDEDAAAMWDEGDITIQLLINGDIKMTYDLDGEGASEAISLSRDGESLARIWDYMPGDKITITNPGGDINPSAEDSDIQKVVTLKFPVKAEAGVYELTIPSKFFTIGGNPVAGYTKSWTIAAPAPVAFESLIISVLPDNSADADKDETAAEVWSDGQIRTQFILSQEIAVNDASTDKVTMTLNGEPFGIALGADSPYIMTNNGAEPMQAVAEIGSLAMIFNPDADDETLAPGEYTLNIPEGFFKLGNNLLSAYTCSWKVAGQPAPSEVSFAYTPADGEEVTEELEDILVDVTGATNVALAEDNNKIVLTKGDEKVELVGIVFGQQIDYMILNPLSNGIWTATIPANSIMLDGAAYGEALTWNFTVNVGGSGNDEVKPVVSPEAGKVNAADLATITLTFPEDAVVVPAEEDRYQIMINPAKPASGFGVLYTFDYEASKDNVLVLKYSGVIDDMVSDTWTLSIGANSYTVNGVANEAFDVVYEVTSDSVAGIFADAEAINAYTVNGVAVILNGTADDLRQLPAGIYVINGTKVIIRK